jgi:hypothetical protein
MYFLRPFVPLAALLLQLVSASPSPKPTAAPNAFTARDVDIAVRDMAMAKVVKRTDPYFPESPPSCTICQKDWPNLQSCSNSCAVFANPALIIFAPQTFVDVIKCSCTDTFKASFPQCVDCFTLTNQTEVLQAQNLPAVLDGMRKICALESTLLGGVASTNSQLVGQTPISVAPPSSTGAAKAQRSLPTGIWSEGILGLLGVAVLVL